MNGVLTTLNALSILSILLKLINPSIKKILNNELLQPYEFMIASTKIVGILLLCVASHVSAIVMMRFSVRHTENGKNSDFYETIGRALISMKIKQNNIPRVYCALVCVIASLPVALLALLLRITAKQGSRIFQVLIALKTIAFAIPFITSTIVPAILNRKK